MPEAVTLNAGGRRYGGWKKISIEIDFDAGASSFELGVTERWPGQPDRWALEAGASAEVRIGEQLVISGYIDVLEAALAGDQHSVTIRGRSKAGDLVDCSAMNRPGSWRGRRLEQIAIELVEPFGIAVHVRADTGRPFRQFAIQPGETVWAALQRMAAHRGLLVTSAPNGDVEIISPGRQGTAVSIVQGRQPMTIEGGHDVSDRFSQYVVKGQSAGTDEHHGRAAAGSRAEAADSAVTRYRPLLIVAEDQADTDTCRRRAIFEANVRAAKAQSVKVTIPDWVKPDGQLWWPQAAIDLDAPAAWMAGPMMAAGVKFLFDEQGRRAEVRIVKPEAYAQFPVPEEAEASRVRRGDRRDRRRRERDQAQPAAAEGAPR